MKKILHSIRVAYDVCENDSQFNQLLELLKKYPCGISQVSLFTSGIHSPRSLAEMEKRASIIKGRLESIRKLGLYAGINNLTTIGHHEEDLEHCVKGNYTNMTGVDGGICRGSFCMNDENFLEEYVKPCYIAFAKAKPDHIWIDDDIRYGHLPIGFGCFCDVCIDKFNKENGTSFSRETLIKELDSGNMELKKAWLRHNSNAIINILKLIGDTVRSIDPNIMLGFMTGERYFEGYAFKEFAEALSDGGKYEIMWRPGGGAYTDYRFDEIVEKSEQIGRQNAYLPHYVTISQSEIENFPYQILKKTPTSTALEAALTMTSGCTGAAFNILPTETGEDLANIVPHLKAIDRILPFYELLSEKTAGKQPFGIQTGWRPDSQLAVKNFTNGYGGMFAAFARELFDFGLPQSYRADLSAVKILKGNCMEAWTDDEIIEVLKGGVYMDASALNYINSRGFSDLTGFAVGKEIPVDAIECYKKHHINNGFENNIRNGRQAFNPNSSFELIPTKQNTQCLSQIIDYHNKITADCCMGIYKNEMGGTVCVSGYYPFDWISDYNKTLQLKRLMVELSNNELPSYVESYLRIRNHTFVCGNKITVALCNPTNEYYEKVKVAIKTDSDKAFCYDQKCNKYELSAEDRTEASPYRIFEVKELRPFEMELIEV